MTSTKFLKHSFLIASLCFSAFHLIATALPQQFDEGFYINRMRAFLVSLNIQDAHNIPVHIHDNCTCLNSIRGIYLDKNKLEHKTDYEASWYLAQCAASYHLHADTKLEWIHHLLTGSRFIPAACACMGYLKHNAMHPVTGIKAIEHGIYLGIATTFLSIVTHEFNQTCMAWYRKKMNLKIDSLANEIMIKNGYVYA